jgi:hypothetical protein
LIIFSQDIASFVGAAVRSKIEATMQSNQIFKRDEEVMSKELETLSQQIEAVTNNTSQLQLE